jgi:hypothetical protein
MTPYRAELCGLVSTLFMIHWICEAEKVADGIITIYCDNEVALNQTFSKALPSNNSYKYLTADIDMITCARDILLQLPVTVQIKHAWVKGHFQGKKRELQHELNSIADVTAREYNSHRRPEMTTPPVPCPTLKVELIHNNQIISSRLLQLAKDAVHRLPLHLHIVRRAAWPTTTVECVDWIAHKQAIKRYYSRVKRLSISKLAHGLHHTNYQINKLYGTPSTCPCCHLHVETLSHVFTCPSEDSASNRIAARATLAATLEKLKTPQKLIDTILHGLLTWEQQQYNPDQPSIPLFRGTVIPADCHLIQAFNEQGDKIGW